METLAAAVRRHADAHADPDGVAATPIPGLVLMRVSGPTGLTKALYRPVLCLVLQGAKEVTAGVAVHRFAAGRALVVGADIPVSSRVIEASRAAPYLALALALDLGVMRDVMAELAAAPPPAPSSGHDPAILVDDTDAAVADCASRLVRLLERPAAVPVLRAPIVTEMHYWLLAGRHGAAMRRLALPDGPAARVARAVALLRAGFAGHLPVERLAAAAGMSPSSFHQHFKAVTTLSPLQFQKHLRLLEARRLMLNEGHGATRAAFAVGYESVSHFTRDYARMFGTAPSRDMGEGRAAA